MILRGIDRAHDIDMGPSNGTHTRGPVSGGLVQPAPPIPNGRKGPPPPPRPSRTAEGQRLYRARLRAERGRTDCGLLMPRSGAICNKPADHRDHCRHRKPVDL